MCQRKPPELKIDFPINLEEFFSPIKECICFELGNINQKVITELERNEFGQAPVRSNQGIILGLIDTSYAKKLFKNKKPIKKDDKNIRKKTICKIIDLEDLLDVMSMTSSVLVTEECGTEQQGGSFSCCGLLTVSDLNKHRFRNILYELIAEIESNLAHLIEHNFKDHMEWINRLSEDKQVRILGFWRLSEIKNVNIGPIAACTISELINIAAKFPRIRTFLDFKNRSQFEENTKSIPELRNKIMHPVRPLVLCCNDVARLKNGIFMMKKLRLKFNS